MTNTVSQPVSALTADQKAGAYDQGARYARSNMEQVEVATAAAKTLGTAPTFEQWEAYRVEWLVGHANERPALTGNAHDAAWASFATMLDVLFGLTKPKSTSPAAEKKAAERAKKTEELLAKHADTPVIELRDKLAKTYEQMAKNPENKDLKKQQAELEKVVKLRTSEENKAHGEALKTLRAQVREAVGKCTDIEKLEAVAEILDEYTDIAYTIED